MFGGRSKSRSMRKLNLVKEEPMETTAGEEEVAQAQECVQTPYGLGHVMDKDEEMYTVKFNFGTASIHEDVVVPTDGIAKWLHEVQLEKINHRAKLAQLESDLQALQTENERLNRDASAARTEANEARIMMEAKEKKAKAAAEDKEKRMLAELSWNGISDEFTAKISGISAWKISLQSCELVNANLMDGKYFAATIVNEMGTIIGRSAQSKTNKIQEPLYIVSGSLEEPRYLFLKLKQIKSKTNMVYKFSEMGYSFVDLADPQFTPGTQRLRVFKKPVDYTRDPKKMKAVSWMVVDVSLVRC